MHNRKILTRSVLATIPAMVARGMSREQIAAELGCKLPTLQVRCSQSRISLRRDRPANMYTTIRLDREVLTMLHDRAAAKGESETSLARRLLQTIARDNLFDAVLDEAA
jgi:hypothetical protein